MSKRDYYKVLDVPKTATEVDIKKAYRRLAMKYHPDRNPNDKDAEERFKEAKEACEVLTDAQKRAAYDQYGHAGVEAASRGGGRSGFAGGGALTDIFSGALCEIFRGGAYGDWPCWVMPRRRSPVERGLALYESWVCRSG